MVILGAILLLGTKQQEVFAQNYLSQSTFHFLQYKDAKPYYTTIVANKGSRSKAIVINNDTNRWWSTNWTGVSGKATLNLEVPSGRHGHSYDVK